MSDYHRAPPSSQTKRRRPPHERTPPTPPLSYHAAPPPQCYPPFQRQQQYHRPQQNGTTNTMAHSSNGRDTHSLRRRGTFARPDTPPNYLHSSCNMGVAIEEYDTLRMDHRSPLKSIPATRLLRTIAMSIVCFFIYWGSIWGIEIGIGMARVVINVIFGNGRIIESSFENQMDDESQSTQSIQIHSEGLRGSTDAKKFPQHDSEISIHDLNAKSHLLKAEGRQIINDQPMDHNDHDGKGDKSYMGQDSTNDFFFAGAVVENKRIVNEKGRLETISYPAHSFASLPVLLDSDSFAISLWINLSPSDDWDTDGVVEDSRRPRVILSISSKGDGGCPSDVLGGNVVTGFVLFAQPHYGDGIEDDEGNTYRVILEYAQNGMKSCRNLIGANHNQYDRLLVREGNWHHVALFATKTRDGYERVSLYVDGDLAGRNEDASRQYSNFDSDSKTIVGRYATYDGTGFDSSSDAFYLGGRVGMLSFWETGNPVSSSSTITERMKIQSASDEDHVVRAVNRCAFDIRAILELSLQGLTVKEPTMLYAFDGQKKRTMVSDLYSESARVVKELIAGINGEIISELVDGIPAHQRQAFIPLGGNRYAEYKDGAYVPPILKSSQRRELNEISLARSGVVVKAMKHAWGGYKKYAYGKDELLPISQDGQDNWGGMGTTLVDSLRQVDTLWMMGMKEEFWEARDWIRENLDFSQVKGGVSVFETTIRNLGGLLSAYDLSGDKVFLWSADDLGMRLLRSFESRTGIPYGQVELFDGGRAYNTGWHQNEAVLSEIGTLQVEFRYLAKITGKSEYATVVMRALDELLLLGAESGLYPTFIDNTKEEPSFGNEDISIGAMGDSFYEYLLKVWLQGGRREMKYRRMYDESVNGIMDKLVHMSRPNYLTYVAELKRKRVIHKMDHLSCFLGGTLALGAYTHPDGLKSITAQRQLRTGKQLAYTCYQMYARSKSGLAPEYVNFDNQGDDFAKGNAPYYILRPETAETFYILYHLTKDPVYREWGWEIFQAIEEHCKTDAGYAAIQDVDTMQQSNRMESFFLAETLKYLYLLQEDTHDIDLLNTHVFNTEAHPLRLLSLAPESF